jgi:agmatine deiminase
MTTPPMPPEADRPTSPSAPEPSTNGEPLVAPEEAAPLGDPLALSEAEPVYRLPAEWEPRAGTVIAWPHQREDWPGKFGPIPWVFAEIVQVLSQRERVWVLIPDDAHETTDPILDRLDRCGTRLDAIELLKVKTDRCWLRDSGPMLVEETTTGRPVVVDWKFNAWAKYSNWRRDNRVPRALCRRFGWERIKPRILVDGTLRRLVLEGGAIDSNGSGTLLTTEECLLDTVQQRNPSLDRAGYEAAFARFLGIRRTIWLGRGIVGDDTHGHVDDLARFVNPNTVVVVVEPHPADPNYEPTQNNLKRLRDARDAHDQPLNVATLPMPRPVIFDGQRLPASYANFYLGDGVALVPTFNDPADRVALATLADLLPDREVIGIHARDLVWGLGTLHCLARDLPRISQNA